LYFGSDRGGTMGIWRIRVDESSGRAEGDPEPVVAGADGSMNLPHLSKDGTALVFSSELGSINPAAIAFDPVSAHITSVSLLQKRTGNLVPTDVSPDGNWLALNNRQERQQDIFVMRRDGSELTRLTNDMARDWGPRFTPDGSALTFYSNLSGKYDAWSIQRDGSGRTRLSRMAGGIQFTMFAPDGRRLYMGSPRGDLAWIGTPPWPVTDRTVTPIADLRIPEGIVEPTYWSRDGRWLSGYIDRNGEEHGHALLDPVTKQIRVLNEDSFGQDVAWMPDYQHIVYFTKGSTLVMQDIKSLARRTVTGTLPDPPENSGAIVASPDGRTLYYGAQQIQANIWMVRRAGAAASGH
ncbi:MAG: TolB family protein, partial [Gemmatimonadales bacterium]